LRSPRLSGGATFKIQRQLVAESLVFDRCTNERGSSTALTSAAVYRRISIPHLGFRYGYWSAAGSLNAGVRVCSGVAASSSRRKARLYDLRRTDATGPDSESSIDSCATPADADSFAKWKVNHA
jgi:hypothetical protein